MNIKTKGIVIRRMNYGEADRILTVFTERLGKVKVISRGVRKIKSHLAGSLEPFMVVNLELYEGKTFYTVTGTSIEKDYDDLHNSLRKTSQAFYVAELVDLLFGENEKSLNAFALIEKTLDYVNTCEKNIFTKAYVLKIIEVVGFRPELHNCVHCKEKISPEKIYWDNIEGGVICPECQSKFRHGRPVSDKLIKLFRFLQESPYEKIDCLKMTKSLEGEAEVILSDYINGIIEKEPKSKKFMLELALEGKGN